MDEHNEDGYQIVQDNLDSLLETQKNICNSEINRNKGNIYCGDIVNKYDGAYPIWVFVEIIPFGRLVAFYSTNSMIKGIFDFLKMVVDSWFKTVQNI